MKRTAANSIRKRVQVLPKGSVVVTSDFARFTNDNMIRQIIFQLAKEGILIPLGKGLYKKKNFNELFGEEIPVEPQLVADAYARKMNWTISPSKNLALNILGLSTQVPNVYTYNSSGPTTKLSFAEIELEFTHINPRNISNRLKSNLIIEAMKYLGRDNVHADDLKIISNNLEEKEYNHLLTDAQRSSAWIRNNIDQMEKYI